MRLLHRARKSQGFALPAALATIIMLGFVVLAIVELLRGPVWLLADSARRDQDLVAAESLLELARARWLKDPALTPSVEGVTISPSTTDSCLWSLRVEKGVATISETWLVSAPTRYAAYLDSGIVPPLDSRGIASLHIVASGLCETGLIDTSLYMRELGRRLEARSLDAFTVRNEVVFVRASDTVVRISNLEVEGGLLIVEGDLILSGTLECRPREDLPFLIVTGSLGSDAHGTTPWTAKGLIAVGRDAFIAGPLTLEGTIVASTLSGTGSIDVTPLSSSQVAYHPKGFGPWIYVVGRSEEFSR